MQHRKRKGHGMTFRQAQALIKAVANGEYCSVRLRFLGYNLEKQECSVYIDGSNWYERPTFEEAFDSLMDELYGDVA